MDNLKKTCEKQECDKKGQSRQNKRSESIIDSAKSKVTEFDRNLTAAMEESSETEEEKEENRKEFDAETGLHFLNFFKEFLCVKQMKIKINCLVLHFTQSFKNIPEISFELSFNEHVFLKIIFVLFDINTQDLMIKVFFHITL